MSFVPSQSPTASFPVCLTLHPHPTQLAWNVVSRADLGSVFQMKVWMKSWSFKLHRWINKEVQRGLPCQYKIVEELDCLVLFRHSCTRGREEIKMCGNSIKNVCSTCTSDSKEFLCLTSASFCNLEKSSLFLINF